MDTYGDMVTLLLCFFVLLYSMSTISEDNWKALVMSFNPKAVQEQTQTPGGDGPSADADEAGFETINPFEGVSQSDIDDAIEELFQAMQSYVAEADMQSQITVTKEGGKVFISFSDNTQLFFLLQSVGYVIAPILPIIATHIGYTFGTKEKRIFGSKSTNKRK